MLEPALKEQLKGIFAGLEADFTFDISVSASHESRAELHRKAFQGLYPCGGNIERRQR